MKRITCALLLLAFTTGAAWAGEGADQGFYIGLLAGKHKIDDDDVSGGAAGGLMGGYRIANGFAVEVAFTGSDLDLDKIFPDCTLELDTAAVYGAYRSSGMAYFKGRIGFLREEFTSRDSCVGLINEEGDSGMSLGVGGGLRFGKGALEIEYTVVEQDVDQIAVNLLYNF